MITRDIWQKLLVMENEVIRRGEIFSRVKIQKTMHCTTSQARRYDFLMQNRGIVKLSKFDQSGFDGLFKPSIKVGGISDIHVPYQDPIALEAALSFLESYNPDILIILGDLLDFYKLSRFVKKTGHKGVSQEIIEARGLLCDIRKRFPKAQIIFKEGNHDSHMERYIMAQAPEIADLLENLLQEKLHLDKLEIEYRKEFFQIGKLWYLHGHEKQGGGQAEHICDSVFRQVYDHAIFGHHHRTQEKIYKRIDESTLWVGGTGHLAGKMEYAQINRWNQGFFTVDYGANGYFRAHLHKIDSGCIY
jgi:predicted phosphodiesterase